MRDQSQMKLRHVSNLYKARISGLINKTKLDHEIETNREEFPINEIELNRVAKQDIKVVEIIKQQRINKMVNAKNPMRRITSRYMAEKDRPNPDIHYEEKPLDGYIDVNDLLYLQKVKQEVFPEYIWTKKERPGHAATYDPSTAEDNFNRGKLD